jgi:hypothetical protein
LLVSQVSSGIMKSRTNNNFSTQLLSKKTVLMAMW